MEVTSKVISINGPDHSSCDVKVVHEQRLDLERLDVVVAHPVGSVEGVRSPVAVVSHDGPILGISTGEPRQRVIVKGLLDLLEAPDTCDTKVDILRLTIIVLADEY